LIKKKIYYRLSIFSDIKSFKMNFFLKNILFSQLLGPKNHQNHKKIKSKRFNMRIRFMMQGALINIINLKKNKLFDIFYSTSFLK
jgi:hypothetical protein